MNEIEAHIKRVFDEIPESRRKQEIMQEIIQNLNEKVSDLIKQGQPREQAVKTAIEDFGDINDLKKELMGSERVEKSQKTGLSLAFSLWGSVLIIALFLFINLYYSPSVIWFVYPTFAVIWWPMSVFFHWYRLKTGKSMGLAYSVCSSVILIGLFCFINFYYTPHIIWFVYPTFGVIWWPMSMFFYRLRQKSREDDIDE